MGDRATEAAAIALGRVVLFRGTDEEAIKVEDREGCENATNFLQD